MTINDWLKQAEPTLKQVNIPSARLDCLILLEHVTGKEKSWILAHIEQNLYAKNTKLLDGMLKRRAKGEPIAYVLGWKEFYGRRFKITADVLIPRPETEGIIEIIKQLDLSNDITAIDVGTGSGCIAITLKREFPSWQIQATDISDTALNIARQNAKDLGAEITFHKSDLLSDIRHLTSDLIIANLPYVDTSWQTRGTDFEPPAALYADEGGLSLIKELVKQAGGIQESDNWLVLEADPRQHDEIIAYAKDRGYSWFYTEGYCIAFKKQ